MEICETCKKLIKNNWDKITRVNDRKENIYFCSSKCMENFN